MFDAATCQALNSEEHDNRRMLTRAQVSLLTLLKPEDEALQLEGKPI